MQYYLSVYLINYEEGYFTMNANELLNNLERDNLMGELTVKAFNQIDALYPVKMSEHIYNNIKTKPYNGVYKQFVPNPRELEDVDGVGAFFEDEKHLSSMVVKKYPNRCIIYATSQCFAHCRHCSRKENWKENMCYSKFEFDKALVTISEHSKIEEVIITGGDVFTISPTNLEYMIKSLKALPHIRVIRLGTRAFTACPSVVTEELCEVLKKYAPLIVSTQFNHPDEFTPETISAIKKVQGTGCSILNQSTLLRDINDTYEVMKELLAKCTENGVIPYYLFHCFKVRGAQCFRTPVETGIEIINQLVGNVGGWWIPRYTLIPHTTGIKIPVRPNGIIINNSDELVLKDFLGRTIKYE